MINIYVDGVPLVSEQAVLVRLGEMLLSLVAGGHVLASRDEGWVLAGEGPPWGLPWGETGSQ